MLVNQCITRTALRRSHSSAKAKQSYTWVFNTYSRNIKEIKKWSLMRQLHTLINISFLNKPNVSPLRSMNNYLRNIQCLKTPNHTMFKRVEKKLPGSGSKPNPVGSLLIRNASVPQVLLLLLSSVSLFNLAYKQTNPVDPLTSEVVGSPDASAHDKLFCSWS